LEWWNIAIMECWEKWFLHAVALYFAGALLLAGCVTTTFRPAAELVAPLPAEDCELVYEAPTIHDESRPIIIPREVT
jgi:hypothetical protein